MLVRLLYHLIAIVLFLVSSLATASAQSDSVMQPSMSPIPEITATPAPTAPPTPVPTAEEYKTIIIPGYVYMGMTPGEVKRLGIEEKGFVSVTLNEDGSYTCKMTRNRYIVYKAECYDDAREAIKQLEEYIPCIKKSDL